MPSDVRVLEGLKSVSFGLSFAKIVVAKSSSIAHPELDFGDADDKDFKIEFVDGRLVVKNAPFAGGPTVIHSGNMTTTISGGVGSVSFISGNDIVINGNGITVDGVKIQGSSDTTFGASNEKVVTLNVPARSRLDYDLETARGDINFDVDSAGAISLVTARGSIDMKAANGGNVKLESARGSIAVLASKLESLSADTARGEIAIFDLESAKAVSVQSNRGDIVVRSSNAPSWSLSSHRGNIDVSDTTGQLNTEAFRGNVQVR